MFFGGGDERFVVLVLLHIIVFFCSTCVHGKEECIGDGCNRECPKGFPIVACSHNPCTKKSCLDNPKAVCKSNNCGGCNTEWFVDGKKFKCERTSCEDYCPLISRPVCGSDGKTYDNVCKLQIAQCKGNSIVKQYNGWCKPPTECEKQLSEVKGLLGEFTPRCTSDGAFEPKQCHGSIGYCWCVDVITGKAIPGTREDVRKVDNVVCKPPCEKLCNSRYDPVCSSDGRTYINKCELENIICKEPSVHLRSKGVCPMEFSSSKTQSIPKQHCPKACNRLYNPQCGTDGKSYGSKCLLKVQKCKDPNLKWVHAGRCKECKPNEAIVACTYQPCAQKRCVDKPNAVCKPHFCGGCNAEWYLKGRQINCEETECIEACPYDWNPMCGSNDVTYSNDCTFKLAQCKDNSIYLKNAGPCKAKSTIPRKVTIGGKVQLLPSAPNSFAEGSCFTVSVTEEILCDVPPEGGDGDFGGCSPDPLGTIKTKNFKVNSDGTISYSISFTITKDVISRLVVQASVKSSCEDDTKSGDYITMTSFTVEIVDGKDDYNLDLDIEKFIIQPQQMSECKPGIPLAICTFEPCAQKRCADKPGAVCKPNFCGGCNAEWYLKGRKINCEKTECIEACPFDYNPMCGSNDVTYSNDCTFKLAQCKDNSIYLKNAGPCKAKSTIPRKVTIGGKVQLLPSAPNSFAEGSCFTVSVTEEILCDVPPEGGDGDFGDCSPDPLGTIKTKNFKVNSDGTISYSISFTITKDVISRLVVQASVKSSCEDDTKSGDYITMTSFTVEIVDGKDDYNLDLDIEKFIIQPQQMSVCKPGIPLAICTFEPCAQKRCADKPGAVCKPNFCGGCNAEWYLKGRKINCEKTECIEACPFDYNPMCGSNDVTYSNDCTFKLAQCKDNSIYLKNAGPCKAKSTIPRKVTIGGKVQLLPSAPNSFAEGSCFTVSVTEEILCDVPPEGGDGDFGDCSPDPLGTIKTKNFKVNSDGTISYSISFTITKDVISRLVVQASVKSSCEDDTKSGDYITMTSFTVEIVDGKDDYNLDLDIEKFIIQPQQTSATVKSCNDRVAEVGTGRRLLGAFVPQCDDNGEYKNKQCHGSIGFCWCVNTKTGVEIEGTRRRGALECGCTYEGRYIEQGKLVYDECNRCTCSPVGLACTEIGCQTGVCYNEGKIIENGESFFDGCNSCQCVVGNVAEVGVLRCTERFCPPEETMVSISGKVKFSPPLRSVAPNSCLRMTVKEEILCDVPPNGEGIGCNIPDLGSFQRVNPKLNADGSMDYEISFTAFKQLNRLIVDATLNLGWCKTGDESIRNGDYITTTSQGVSVQKGTEDYRLDVDVEQYKKPKLSPCRLVKQQTVLMAGQFVPQCGTDGSYKKQQCHGSTGYCWCVDKKTGTKIEGTQGRLRGPVNCNDEKGGKIRRQKCLRACTFIYDPVCASDGRTISNECVFKYEQCLKSSLTLVKRGECNECPRDVKRVQCAVNPCDTNTCPAFPKAKCCGQCSADFFVDGKKVDCSPPRSKPSPIATSALTVRIDSTPPKVEQCYVVCPKNYKPVCGSDGRTYTNDCIRTLQECVTNTIIFNVHDGECGVCRLGCPRIYDPNCGTDNVNYGNDCEMKKKTCMTRGKVARAYKGKCGKPICREDCTSKEHELVCGDDGVTYKNLCEMQKKSCDTSGRVKLSHNGACRKCSLICTSEYDPYCGTNNKVYNNKCGMDSIVCQSGGKVQLKYRGKCGSPVCPKTCPNDRNRVCGTNDQTYANLCQLQKVTCKSGGDVYLRNFGGCVSRCKSFEACPAIYTPVCGTDGKTYSNHCEIRRAMCKSNGVVRKVHSGLCKTCKHPSKCLINPCDTTFCARYPRAKCVPNYCSECEAVFYHRGKKVRDCGKRCNSVCTLESFPVCGSDGKTYGNICMLNLESCKTNGKVRKSYDGQCKITYYK